MKKFGLFVVILLLALVPAVATADGPIENRSGRAEVRFLEGMIDHHQMALDMATHCLGKAETEALQTLCQNVIDAQSAEIAQMQGWLLEWYNIAYTPMSMVGDHSDHEAQESADSDSGMGGMDMGMGMMGDMTMNEMMSMMQMMQEMDMSAMMEMMQNMEGMEGMSMMEMMMQHMGMMGNNDDADHSQHNQQNQQDQGGEHDQHHPEGALTDPSMTMGMMAGFDRLDGVAYEIAWLESMIDHHDDALHMAERILQYEVHAETLELAQAIIDAQTAEIADMEALILELSAE